MKLPDLLRVPYGTLNKMNISDPRKEYFNLRGGNAISSLHDIIVDRFTPDYLNGSVEFKAIVLLNLSHIEGANNSNSEPGSDLNLFSIIKEAVQPAPLIKLKCRIPELHAHLPIPASSDDYLNMELYPTFTGVADGSRGPVAGDIVRVTFKNIHTLEGPVYLGNLTDNSVASVDSNSTENNPINAFKNEFTYNGNFSLFPNSSEKEPLITIGADKWKKGYERFTVRQSTGEKLQKIIEIVRAAGGVINSGGGARYLKQSVSPTRSNTSLHYTGRAIDLVTYAGMVNPKTDPYVVELEDKSKRLWRVWVRVENGETRTIEAYKNNNTTETVTGTFLDLTALFKSFNFERIPALRLPLNNYLEAEWWHFQDVEGLIVRQTTFGEELLKIWSPKRLENTGPWAYKNAVWNGNYFT